MNTDYLLFVDTETTGLPKKWNEAYSTKNNWPHIVQIAWIITDFKGKVLKKENHYIKIGEEKISENAYKIHHISSKFLSLHGKPRAWVLDLFDQDIRYYQPLLVGHFMELDFHMLKADYFRSDLSTYILDQLPQYCTMQTSSRYVRNPEVQGLRLGEFYTYLFNEKARKMHNALADTETTLKIFFELLNINEISKEEIFSQQASLKTKQKFPDKWISFSFGLFILILSIILLVLLWKLR